MLAELLSNAVRHGLPPLRVTATVRPAPGGRRVLRLEVADAVSAPDPDRIRAHWRHPPYGVATGRRGLFTVDTPAVDRGVTRPPGGGCGVWAELPLPAVSRSSEDHDQSGGAPVPNDP
ncbi:ATP-binding protein [Streptomyces sp. ODS05-4]|uniref:ATP-binding protein n=1 Tax=Streptomyces sp. ODS05-4 TaxID=2944939 RepID=UPI00210AD560|nr:ATP-binding protein [Streptomyces sp. ODS05-4]